MFNLNSASPVVLSAKEGAVAIQWIAGLEPVRAFHPSPYKLRRYECG
jgi:hypothetical protein